MLVCRSNLHPNLQHVRLSQHQCCLPACVSFVFHRAPLLRVIGEKREQIGMKTRDDALQMALEQEVDLILINPNEAPPVARLMEWSK